MKRSLKLLSAAFVAVMLLTAIATPVAMAATPGGASSIIPNADLFILEQLMKGNCIPLSNGNYLIPSIGEVDGDKVAELRKQYWNTWYPGFGGTWYPGISGTPSGLQVVNMEMHQYERKTLGMGTSYTYTSLNPDIVTVDQYGTMYAVAAGEATISLSVNGFTWILVNVTVTGVEFDPEDFSVDLVISKSLLELGESISIYTRLLKDGYYVPMGSEYIEVKVEDDTVVEVNGNTLKAVGVGRTTVTAYIPDTGLFETIDVQVVKKLETPVYPGVGGTWYPGIGDVWYPSYGDIWYPGFGDTWYPGFGDTWYPGFGDTWYPGFGDIWYPSFGDIWYPSFGDIWYPSYNLEAFLGLDADVYKVTYKMMFLQGEWQQILVATPKDAEDLSLSDYTIRYKMYYKDGDWKYIPYLIPKDSVVEAPETPEKPEEDPKEDVGLTDEEKEALEKAEEEAKKLAELKKLIAKALEGKMEWYEVYTDLNGDAVYYNGVEFVLNNQYLTGKDNGKFGVKDAMTFADVKELMIKYLGVTSAEFDKTGILTFKDGEKKITRQEITKAFYNLAVYLKEDVSGKASFARYEDKAKLGADYSTSFAWAIKNSIIVTTSTKMTPDGNVTRGDLARMLHRFDIFANK